VASSYSGSPRLDGDVTFREDLETAIALSLSEEEAKRPRPNINPNSRSAVAIAKEEERQIREAIQQSLAEELKPSALLDREPQHDTQVQNSDFGASATPRLSPFGASSLSPLLRPDIDPIDLPELV